MDLLMDVSHPMGGRSMSEIGDNSALRAYVQRIESLEDNKNLISADIRDVYAEAKSEGFDVRILRKVIARRKRTAEALEEERILIEAYEENLQGELF
jgi:uncharacterized protein (UPF0335 family)